MGVKELLEKFIIQAERGELKTAEYPKEWGELQLKISFGMGAPARVPWIAFIVPEMKVSNGYYPVYLYYKERKTLVLAYGVSDTNDFGETWPIEISSSAETINAHFDNNVPRYGESFVFKSYKVEVNNEVKFLTEDGGTLTDSDLTANLDQILDYYKQLTKTEVLRPDSSISQGLFYMEKQLEDFIIHNWDKTELGKKYNLIIEEGVLLSQQYRTDIGPIDILVKDKKTGSYVVIELKKNQTSDDTVGQIARYMGWVKESLKDANVSGIIIASDFDKKLSFALKMVPNVDVFIYEVDFRLKEFSR